VADNPGSPGDYEDWRAKRPDFDPFRFDRLVQVKSHVLSHALRNLNPPHRRLLSTLAACDMPVTHDSLVALLVRAEEQAGRSPVRPFEDQAALDQALSALAERGLLGWDNRPSVASQNPCRNSSPNSCGYPPAVQCE